MNDLMTLDDIAAMNKCSVRHARDVLVRLPGFPQEARLLMNVYYRESAESISARL